MAKKEIKTGFREQTHNRVDQVMDKTEQMNKNAKETLDHLKQKAKMMRESLDDHIKRKPEQSVLIATGIGVILGAIVTATIMRRRR